MKKCVWILILVFTVVTGHSQNLQEWTKQKKTQIKYLLEQIAALRTYSKYVEKGYEIAKTGLTTIHNIKQGAFNLHDVFFTSLSDVKPSIKNYSRVAEIVALHIMTGNLSKKTLKVARESQQMNAAELDYIRQVINGITDHGFASMSDLTTLVTSGSIQISDDERLRRINNIYTDVNDRYRFTVIFQRQINLLSLQRQQGAMDTKRLEWLYGIDQ